MNRRQKLLCVFFILVMMISYTTLNVFAQAGTNAGTDNAAPTSQAGGNTGAQNGGTQAGNGGAQTGSNGGNDVKTQAGAGTSSNVTAQLSSKPASSSSSAASSRKPRRKVVSSAVSSDISGSDVSSDLFGTSSQEESSAISLPSVDSIVENDPFNSAAAGPSNKKMNLYGILSWACIGLGVLVVLIVVLSNRRPPRGPGRKRYRRPKRSTKKRLLNDRYYRNLNRY